MSASVSYLQADPSYRKDPGHAQSSVKHILKSPAHYQAEKKKKIAPTLTMQIGTGAHCLTLEGKEQFEKDFVLKPDGLSLATREGKAWKEENKSKTILSQTDQYQSWDAVHGMAAALQELDWFDPSQADYRKFNEVSLYWRSEGLDCKARIDRLLLSDTHATILDVKSTDGVKMEDFRKKVIGDFNYMFQAAWYTDGVEQYYKLPTNFIFVAIERTPPYQIGIFDISDEMIDEGFRQIRHARRLLKHCLQTKDWGRPPIVSGTLELPPYYRSPLGDATLGSSMEALEEAFSIPA